MDAQPLRTKPANFGVLLFVCSTLSWAATDVQPGPTDGTLQLRVMTWNIHHGEGMDGRLDLERMGQLIREAKVDLVALQEVDRGVRRTQQRDLPAELAALTGMTCVFSNNYAYQGGEYGNAILSRLPVLDQTNTHYQMLREGEQRGLLQVRVSWAGRQLRFFNTHLDYRPDSTERLAHAARIRAQVEAEPETPAIVAGDFNEAPGRGVHRAMTAFLVDAWAETGEGEGATYPSTNGVHRIDYLFVSPGWAKVAEARVLQSPASDHAPLVVQLRGNPNPESERP